MGSARVIVIGSHARDGFSMRRYSLMLTRAWRDTGATVRLVSPGDFFSRLVPGSFSKYGKYIDKFVVFGPRLWWTTRSCRAVHVADHSDAVYGFFLRKTAIVTCHDLIAVRAAHGELPEHRPKVMGRMFQALITRGLRRFDLIACVSEATRSDVNRLIGRPNRLLSNFVDQSFSGPSTVRHTPPRTDFLVVARGDWRKARADSLMLWRNVVRTDPHFSEAQLTVVGDELRAEELAPLSDSERSRVRLLSAIDDTELLDLYDRSAAIIVGSLYEGFALPIVEANQRGCVAICRDTSVLREVGGEAALYFSSPTEQVALDIADELVRSMAERRRDALSNALRYTYDVHLAELGQIGRSVFAGESFG